MAFNFTERMRVFGDLIKKDHKKAISIKVVIPRKKASPEELKMRKTLRDRKYRREHVKEARARSREWYEKNRKIVLEKQKIWREENHDAIVEYQRNYRHENPEINRKAVQKYYEKNAKQILERRKVKYASKTKFLSAKKRCQLRQMTERICSSCGLEIGRHDYQLKEHMREHHSY